MFLSITRPIGVSAATSSVFPARARAGQFWAFAKALAFLMDCWVVLRLRSVSPFTSGRFQPVATPVPLYPLKNRPIRQRSVHPRIARTFSPKAYRTTTERSDGVGLHRSWLRSIFSRWSHAAPLRPPSITTSPTAEGTSGVPQRFTSGRWLAHFQAEMQSPEVFPPGPFATNPSPVLPVDPPWLRTLVESCEVRAESSVRVRTRTGRFRCSVSPSLLHLSVCSKVDLVLSHCGSRSG